MAEPIANDWKAIHDRMQQIQAERSPSPRRCLQCNDRGWMRDYLGERVGVCDVCRNPKNLPRPGPERRGKRGLGMSGFCRYGVPGS
jgi:hypothetical protein